MPGKFANECLAAMNKHRANHQVGPLSYNSEIEKVAQRWADYIAQTGTVKHNDNCTYNGQELGENIAFGSSSQKTSATGQEVADMWYNEIEKYDFNRHGGPGTGHFTQVVWKDSKEVGIGIATSRDGRWYVVADYYPPGNFNRQEAKNVFPPKDGKIPVSKRNDDSGSNCFHQHKNSEWSGGTSKSTSTKTVTNADGSKVTTVTEKTQGPGPVTRIKVTETVVRPDGRTTTSTRESEEGY